MNRHAFFIAGWLVVGLGLVAETALAKRYAAIVVHDDTGEVLHSRGADAYRYPASITKVMTLYLLFEAIEKGKLTMNSRLKVSAKAARASPSKLYLQRGDTIRVRDAIGTLITKSANDVAVAVAEALGKTEANFARMMTQKARELGMSKTTYRNASGLHHSKQRTTVRDIATLARRVRRDFPQYYPLFSMKSYTYRGTTYRSHNRLLRTYAGMEGMKTGYINASGFNLVAVAKRNNQRVVTVVVGGRSSSSRNKQVAKLMDLGFSRIPNLTVVEAPLPRRLRKESPSGVTAGVAITPPVPRRATTTSQRLMAMVPRVLPRKQRPVTTTGITQVAHHEGTMQELSFAVVSSQAEMITLLPAVTSKAQQKADVLKPLQFIIVE